MFGTSQGEAQMFGSHLLEFLELLWTKVERPEVRQRGWVCLVSKPLSKTAVQTKHWHDGGMPTVHFMPMNPTEDVQTLNIVFFISLILGERARCTSAE